jgi:Flp pilus assembly protein TadG
MRLLANRHGNIALTFGLVAVPLLLGVGVSIDYLRAYNARVKMQSDLDAALLASVKKIDNLSATQLKQQINTWFAAQAVDRQGTYALNLDSVVINKATKSVQAVATGVVPTTFLGLANIPSINVAVATTVSGPGTEYLNVYIVLDHSASMMLAATTSGQNLMKSVTKGCVLACHQFEGGPYTYNGNTYQTNYDLAEGMGVELRVDVAVKAAERVLDMINAADPTHNRIKVGLYSIGSDAKQVLAPTFSTGDALRTLTDDSAELNSATAELTSYFDVSLPKLATFVGDAQGTGKTADTPKKLVLILTDGVESQRPWVMDGYEDGKEGLNVNTTPLNPAWCNDVKQQSGKDRATVGVLYTEYLPMTWDAGYNRTLDDSMKSSAYKSAWGGEIDAGVDDSIKRVDYLPIALKDCATSPDFFMSAESVSEIQSGLASIFDIYMSSVRLTQ